MTARKTSLKKWIHAASNFIALISSRFIRQMLTIFLGVEYQSSGKEKESCCLVFPSSTKREIRYFHDVVLQRRQENVQKTVIHVQSCSSKPIAFLPFPLPSSLLKFPIYVRLGRFHSSFLLIHFRYGPNTCSLSTKVLHRKAYPICDAPLSGSARRSFTPLQKSRQNHRSYAWTEALSGVIFVPV